MALVLGPSNALAHTPPAEAGLPNPQDVHVLLVDDEQLSRLVVCNLLRKCEYKGEKAHLARVGPRVSSRVIMVQRCGLNIVCIHPNSRCMALSCHLRAFSMHCVAASIAVVYTAPPVSYPPASLVHLSPDRNLIVSQ